MSTEKMTRLQSFGNKEQTEKMAQIVVSKKIDKYEKVAKRMNKERGIIPKPRRSPLNDTCYEEIYNDTEDHVEVHWKLLQRRKKGLVWKEDEDIWELQPGQSKTRSFLYPVEQEMSRKVCVLWLERGKLKFCKETLPEHLDPHVVNNVSEFAHFTTSDLTVTRRRRRTDWLLDFQTPGEPEPVLGAKRKANALLPATNPNGIRLPLPMRDVWFPDADNARHWQLEDGIPGKQLKLASVPTGYNVNEYWIPGLLAFTSFMLAPVILQKFRSIVTRFLRN